MNRNGSAIIATIFIGLLLILTAVGLYYVNAPTPGDSDGDSLLISRVGGSLFDQFTGDVQPPRISQIAGIGGSSGGSSSSGGTTPPINPPGNTAPVSNAGLDQTVNEGTLVTLDGSGSSDADSDPLTYSWAQMSGTTTVALSNASAASPTFTAPQVTSNEIYTFRLTVNDGTVSSSDLVNIAVTDVTAGSNAAPVLSISAVSFDEDTTSTIDFNGFVSDADHTDAQMTWSVSGNTNINVNFDANGNAIFTASEDFNGFESITFRATDPLGAFDEQTVIVAVNPINDAAEWNDAFNPFPATVTAGPVNAGDNTANLGEGSIIYSDIGRHAFDVDSPLAITVTSAHPQYDLQVVGNEVDGYDLIITNLAEDGYFDTQTVTLEANGVPKTFTLATKQRICLILVCEIF